MNRAKTNQTGFSIVELLVSMAIMLVVLAATIAAFNDAMRTNEAANLMAAMTQNARVGANLMVQDLIQTSQGVPTGGLPVPNGPGANPINMPSPPGFAYTLPAGQTTLFSLTPGSFQGPVINGIQTDMVTILYADAILPLSTFPLVALTPNGSSVTVDNGVDISTGNNPIQAGDLIMFRNSRGYAIQQVTSVAGQVMNFAINDFFNFNQPNARAGTLRCLANEGTSLDLTNCSDNDGGYAPTTAQRIFMITYYLDATTDPTRPRLIRRVNAGTPDANGVNQGQPVALVLDNLQLSYDLADGVTNQANIKILPPANSPNQLRKANLWLSGRSDRRFSQTGDFLRTTVATQVSLRSLAFVDRYR